MIICQCRNISDKDVNAYLEEQEGEKVRPREIKEACARQDSDECHSCACTFLSLSRDHNAKVMVRDMGETLKTQRNTPHDDDTFTP